MMLSMTWTFLLHISIICAAAATRTRSSIHARVTAFDNEDELRKRYLIYSYYTPDWPGTMTCGVVQPALAVQDGLYGTKTAASITMAPYPIVCEGICANSGNHLGCIDWKGKTVGTTCTDYNPTNTVCDALDDGACFWDMHCDSVHPACLTLVYSGSITQYTCGASKVPPITIDSASMTPFTPSPQPTSGYNTGTNVGTASTATPTVGSGLDSPSLSSFEKALKRVGLSIGALAGICAGALVACCGACCGWFQWKKRRDGRKKYAAPYMHEPVNHATIVQQPLMGHSPAYHTQYHQKQPHWTAIPQAHPEHER